jgi:hypothetical protein
MTFARTLFIAATVWAAAITLLYFALNWEPPTEKFKVGFLPVT